MTRLEGRTHGGRGGRPGTVVAVLCALAATLLTWTAVAAEPTTFAGRVADGAGRPVAGATVTVVPALGDDATPEMIDRALALGAPHTRVVAGDDGRFRVTLPAAGPWRMRVAADGFLTATRTLPPEPDEGLTITLEPAAIVTGAVVDRDGRPLAEVFVVAVPMGLQASDPDYFARAMTDENGRFRMASVTPNTRLRVTAGKEGYNRDHLDLPALKTGTIRKTRLVLEPYDRFVGRVVDGEERPLAGTTVVLRGQVPQTEADQTGYTRVERLETDDDGRFSWSGVLVGEVDLRAELAGYAPLSVPGIPIRRGAGEQDLGTLMLLPGRNLRGRVVDDAGEAIGGATVAARPAESLAALEPEEQPPKPLAETTSGGDGRFALEDLAAGAELDLEVTAAGYAPRRLTRVEVPAASTDGDDTLEIVLAAAPRLTVRVVDGDAIAVGGAVVRAVAERTLPTFGGGVRDAREVLAQTSAGGDGVAVLDDLRPGRVVVEAEADGHQRAVSPALELEAGARDELELILRPGAELHGRVLGPDGAVVEDAEVLLPDAERPEIVLARALSGGDGRYRLRGLPPGRSTLVARHDDYPATRVAVEIAPGEQRLDLRFPAGVEVGGRVLDEEGAAIIGLRLHLTAPGQLVRAARDVADVDGRFRFRHVPDGLYAFVADSRRYVLPPATATVEVRGEPVERLLEAVRSATVTGEVTGLSFDEVAGLEILALDGRSRVAGEVAFDGRYRVEGLAPGAWRVVARLTADGRATNGEVNVEPGGEHRLDLRFDDDGFALRGRLTAAGEPLPGVGLLLRHRERPVSGLPTSTDGDGHFRFTVQVPGRYRLEVVDPARPGLRHGEELVLDGEREIAIDLAVHRVRGRVTSRAGGRGLPGARLRVVPHFGWSGVDEMLVLDATTDGDGGFVLGPVAAGYWRLTVSHPDHASGQWDVVIDDDLSPLELELDAGDGLLARVLDLTGRPPASVHLAITDNLRQPVAGGTFAPDAEGLVRVPGVPPGRWLVWASAEGGAPGRTVIETPSAEPALLTLSQGAVLEVEVPSLAGGARRASFFLVSPRGKIFGRVYPGGALRVSWPLQGGRARLADATPGPWVVKARTVDGVEWTRSIYLYPGQIARAVLDDFSP